MTSSKKDSELEDLFVQKIFYIGEHLPNTDDNERCLFVMLGTPQEFMDDIHAKYITKEESDRRVLEGKIEEHRYITWSPDEAKFIVHQADRIVKLGELLNGDTKR